MSEKIFQIRILSVPKKPKAKIIHIGGEIDIASLSDFKKQINKYLGKEKAETYILFLRDLKFIDSSVIGYFTELFLQIKESERKILFAEGNNNIMDILELVGFLNIVEYYNTIDDAINSLDF